MNIFDERLVIVILCLLRCVRQTVRATKWNWNKTVSEQFQNCFVSVSFRCANSLRQSYRPQRRHCERPLRHGCMQTLERWNAPVSPSDRRRWNPRWSWLRSPGSDESCCRKCRSSSQQCPRHSVTNPTPLICCVWTYMLGTGCWDLLVSDSKYIQRPKIEVFSRFRNESLGFFHAKVHSSHI